MKNSDLVLKITKNLNGGVLPLLKICNNKTLMTSLRNPDLKETSLKAISKILENSSKIARKVGL
jgi:hypothetical protein